MQKFFNISARIVAGHAVAIAAALDSSPAIPQIQHAYCLPIPNFETFFDYVALYERELEHRQIADNAQRNYRTILNADDLTLPLYLSAQLNELSARPRQWRDEDYPQLAAWIDAQRLLINALQDGSESRSYALSKDEYDSNTDPNKSLPLYRYRLICKAMLADSWRTDSTPDSSQLTQAIGKTIKLSRHFESGKTLNEQLLSIAIALDAYAHVLRSLHAELLSNEDVQTLFKLLCSRIRNDHRHAIVKGFRGEKVTCYRALQDLCMKDGKITNRFKAADPHADHILIENKTGVTKFRIEELPKPNELCIEIREYYDALAELVYQRPGESPLDDAVSAARNNVTKRQRFLHHLLPDLSTPMRLAVLAEAWRRGTIMVLSAHLYRSEHSVWPKALREFPGIAYTDIETDPCADQPLRFEVTDDGFQLHSVGKDGKNNDGNIIGSGYEGEPGEDILIWPLRPY